MAGVQLLHGRAILGIQIHQLLLQGQYQILLHSAGTELISNPVTVNSIDIGSEHQTILSVVDDHQVVAVTGQTEALKLAVAEVDHIAFLHDMYIFAGVGAGDGLIDYRICTGVFLVIYFNAPLSIHRSDTVSQVYIAACIEEWSQSTLMIRMIMTQYKDERLGCNFLYTLIQSLIRASRHQAIIQDTALTTFNVVGSCLEVIEETIYHREVIAAVMQLVLCEVVPCRTIDSPQEGRGRAVFQTILRCVALYFYAEVYVIVRKVLIVIQAEHRVGGVSGNVVIPVTPFGIQDNAYTTILYGHTLHLLVGEIEGTAPPVNGCILRGGEPLGTTANELPVRYRH